MDISGLTTARNDLTSSVTKKKNKSYRKFLCTYDLIHSSGCSSRISSEKRGNCENPSAEEDRVIRSEAQLLNGRRCAHVGNNAEKDPLLDGK